jgi:hypothetical protein
MQQALELIQRPSLLRRLELKVEGNKELVVEESGLFKSARFVIPLDQISPTPSHVRNLSVQWIVITAIFGALTLWTLYEVFRENPDIVGVVLFSIVCAITFACYRNTVRLSQNVMIFLSATTGSTMFSIPRNKPSAEAVDRFVEQLRGRIESFRSPSGASREQLLPLYKRHLDYLLGEEVLLQAEYDAAMTRLVATSSPKNVLELVR